MRDATTFRRDARNAYERGRFLAAIRVGAVIAPVTVIAAWETGAVARTVAFGTALWLIAVVARWRMRSGFAVVTSGLQSGALPLAAALALCRFAPSCPPLVAVALCGSTGLLGGVLLGRSLASSPGVPWQRWSAAALVGGLLATLGCLALAVGSAAGAAIGIGLGTVVALNLPRPQRA